METTYKIIPKSIIIRAREVAINQGFLPLSPCSIDSSDSKINLCAAACILYASYESKSQHEAKHFLGLLRQEGSNKILHQACEELGLPVEVCEKLRADNDKSSYEARLSKFISNCDSLIHNTIS